MADFDYQSMLSGQHSAQQSQSSTVWTNDSESNQELQTQSSAIDIVRIVNDDDIKCDIKLDEINNKLMLTDSNPDSENQLDKVGADFPIIRINDRILARYEIKRMTITSIGILPEISLILTFTDTKFMHKNPVKDGDMISVYMRAGNNNMIKFIRNDYIITSCVTTNKKGGGCNVTLSGKLFIDKFLKKNTTVGYIGTSKDVMKKIAKNMKLGFAFNDFDDTDDFQNWILCKDTYENFIMDITDHAWKDEVSFFKTWIDFYYNITFINVNKFLLSEQNDERIDMTMVTNVLEWKPRNASDMYKDDNQNMMPKMLSNMKSFQGTPFYIKKWRPINLSSSVSLSEGYEVRTLSFIHNQKILSNDSEGSFKMLYNIPAYDQNKVDSYILLRGRATYDPNHETGEMERQNYELPKEYVTDKWTGIEYMKGTDEDDADSNNTWSGNVHKNYSRSKYHNEINLMELDKMYITVTCTGLCLQVLRGERIPVLLMYDNISDDLIINDSSSNDMKSPGSRFYTGYYIVDDITYEYKQADDMFSSYSTTFTLKRREWPTPEAI